MIWRRWRDTLMLQMVLMLLMALLLACPAAMCGLASPTAERRFVHPGLLHTRDDLQRMRQAVLRREEPYYSGYLVLRDHIYSRQDYKVQGAFPEVGRNPNVHFLEFDQDANAAYQQTLLWYITGEPTYARNAIRILNAWSATLRRTSGADAVLMASLGPFKMINAAEILRHTDSGWAESDAERFERLLRDVFYPVLKDFALYANGNWDTGAIKALLAIAVYAEDRALFDSTLRYAIVGAGNGRITHYILASGQCQESGRDQQHTQLGLAHLAEAAEIAWHQGLDLFGHASNRILTGFEYTARYNLGEDVEFLPLIDRTGKYRHESISVRSHLRPIFEQVFNHYFHRAGLLAPFTGKAAARLRPEGGLQNADHPGFGTLLFTRSPAAPTDQVPAVPVSPAGLAARWIGKGVELRWVRPRGADRHQVKRCDAQGSGCRILSRNVSGETFFDPSARGGKLYRYSVVAMHKHLVGPESLPLTICAGPPPGWRFTHLGRNALSGSIAFDGARVTLEAEGEGTGSEEDELGFLYRPWKADGSFTARLLPPVSSQFSQMGLVFRSSLDPGAPQVALLLQLASRSANRERPTWEVRFLAREKQKRPPTLVATVRLDQPVVQYGRLLAPVWLRLDRRGSKWRASYSLDGDVWTQVDVEAHGILPDRVLVGLAAASRVEGISTSVAFDQVEIERAAK